MLLLSSGPVMSDFSWLHGRQQVRLPCPSPSPRVCPSSCSLHQWCHSAISSSDALLSFYPQSFPASGSFLLSQLLASGDQNIGASASASVFPVSIQGWFSLRLTSLISLLSKGLSRVFSRTTVRRHEYFGALLRSIGRTEAPKAPKGTLPGRNGEFGLITQAQLQHRVDGERTVEDTEMKETANSFRHSPSCTEIALGWACQCKLKKKQLPSIRSRSSWEGASLKHWTRTRLNIQVHFQQWSHWRAENESWQPKTRTYKQAKQTFLFFTYWPFELN